MLGLVLMKIIHIPSIIRVGALAALTALTLVGPSAFGQATRTWVSGVGDDANPGSRTAPCKTFAGVISKTAPAGEINVLDPGGFGTVTITKSITIDGGSNIAGVLAAGTNGIVISSGSADVVTLKNLDIDGVGTGLNGIQILNAAEVHIENCSIYGFTQKGIDFAPGSTCRLYVKNCYIKDCVQGGVHSHPSAASVVTLTKCHLLGNLFGFRAESLTTATLTDCTASGNMNNGVVTAATSSPLLVNVDGCTVTDNGVYGVVSTGAGSTVRISNNTISQNGTGISFLSGGLLVSYGNNRILGNTTNGSPSSTVSQQ